jgi:hypothetical protein
LQGKTFASCLLGFIVLGIPAFADYSVVENFPNSPTLPATRGVWSYGYSLSLSPFAFVSDTHATSDYFGGGSGIVGYYSPVSSTGLDLPTVLKNTTGSPYTITSIVNWSPNYLLLHPGSEDQYSVVQFTAPNAGTYTFSGAFIGLDKSGPTSTDTHIFTSANSYYSGAVNSYGTAIPFSETITLTQNEAVDFAVGDGGNGYSNDSTGLLLDVTPEPMFYGVLAIGLAGLFLAVRRREA